MPIYEYRCEECGEAKEALQKISDAPLVDCPSCGEPALKKLMSAAAFRLKGGGWYETDFKTGDKKKNLAGEEKAKSDKGGDKKTADGKSADGKKSDTSSSGKSENKNTNSGGKSSGSSASAA